MSLEILLEFLKSNFSLLATNINLDNKDFLHHLTNLRIYFKDYKQKVHSLKNKFILAKKALL